MLLAVKAKRVTFISSASSGSAAASGSGVSITLHCCRSLRATTKSVDGIVSIPALHVQQSLRRTMTVLQQQHCLKRSLLFRSWMCALRSVFDLSRKVSPENSLCLPCGKIVQNRNTSNSSLGLPKSARVRVGRDSMDFTGILVQLAYVAIFVGIAYFAVDQYRLWRERRVEAWRKDGHLPKPKGAAESGTNGKGELSTAAKYAIWNYMFSLFAVGGTIIGIVSGIAGYMIKDLATERAIQTALNKMQEPLSSQLDKF